MRTHARVVGLGAAVLAVAAWFLAAVGDGGAAGQDKKDDKQAKEIQAILFKLADAIEQKNDAEKTKQTEALKKFDLLPVMEQMKRRSVGGIGFGKPGTVPAEVDGIDAKLLNMSRNRPALTAKDLDKQADDIARAAYIVAAIAELAPHKCPVKVRTKLKDDVVQDPVEWAMWSKDMQKHSRELAEAAKKKDVDKVKTVTQQLYSTCNNCHGPFRN